MTERKHTKPKRLADFLLGSDEEYAAFIETCRALECKGRNKDSPPERDNAGLTDTFITRAEGRIIKLYILAKFFQAAVDADTVITDTVQVVHNTLELFSK